MLTFNVDLTYIFELCTPANRVVVEHFSYKVTLLAVLDTQMGTEYHIETFDMKGIPVCQTYDLSNLADMIEFVSDRNPTEYEGIVAVDKNFNRVKVKNPGYLALSRIKDSALKSPRSLVELCLLGKLDDALPLLPDHIVERANKLQEALRGFIRDSEGVYYRVVYDAGIDAGVDLVATEVAGQIVAQSPVRDAVEEAGHAVVLEI